MGFGFHVNGRAAALLTGAALLAAVASTSARADVVGRLDCNIAAGSGAIIASQRNVSCTFTSNGGPVELYNGAITRLGVDIGDITAGTLSYDVVEVGSPAPGILAGNYVGPGFGITLGNGIGLNALVGGNGNAITLQPISATTTSGLNFNAGIGALRLAYVGPAEPPMMRRHHHRMHHHHHM